jgi:hypothetical protein
VVREKRLCLLLQSSAGVGIGVEEFGLDLQSDELSAGRVALLLEAVRVDEPRGVIRGVGGDRGHKEAEVGRHSAKMNQFIKGWKPAALKWASLVNAS